MAKEAYYFSHDSNAQDDPKIMSLIDTFKMEGYGAYWSLIEKLRQDAIYRLPLSTIPSLSKRMSISTDKLNRIVKDFELFKYDENFFWSESLIRRMQKRSEGGKAGAAARWSNANALPSDAEALRNDAIKGKKGNKKKRKEIDFIAPSLDEFKKYFSDNGYNPGVGERAWNAYTVANWFDSQGNEIKSWKSKCQTVWFKDENKIPPPAQKEMVY